jgi:hypothetical protein
MTAFGAWGCAAWAPPGPARTCSGAPTIDGGAGMGARDGGGGAEASGGGVLALDEEARGGVDVSMRSPLRLSTSFWRQIAPMLDCFDNATGGAADEAAAPTPAGCCCDEEKEEKEEGGALDDRAPPWCAALPEPLRAAGGESAPPTRRLSCLT